MQLTLILTNPDRNQFAYPAFCPVAALKVLVDPCQLPAFGLRLSKTADTLNGSLNPLNRYP